MKNRFQKIISWEDRKDNILTWLIFIGAALLFWGTDYRLDFNNDSYYTFQVGWDDRAYDMLARNGRIFAACLYKFNAITGISDSTAYQISFFLGILFCGSALFVLYNLLKRYLSRFWAVSLSIMLVMNPLMVDFFFCFEASQFLLGVLLAVLADTALVRYLEKKRRKDILLTFLFVLGSVFCYQSLPGLFIMIAMPFLIKYAEHNIFRFIKSNVTVVVLYAAANVISLLTMTALGSNKIVGVEKDWLESFKTAKFALNIAWKNNFWFFTFLPERTPYYLIVLIVCISILHCTMNLYRERKWGGCLYVIWDILSLGYLLSGAFLLQLFLLMVGYGRPRICYPIGALFGTLVLWYFINFMAGDKQSSAIKQEALVNVFHTTLCCVAVAYIVSEFFCFQSTIIDKYTTNARDKYTIEIIGQKIEEYEETSGIEITKVAFYKDANVGRGYADVVFVQDIQTRSFFDWYSDIYSLNYYLGTNYERGETKDEYEEYFTERNWDTFADEQLIFEGNELHICMY